MTGEDLRALTLRSPSGKTRTILLEGWRPIPGYEGAYEVSDRGRVRSLARVVRRRDGRHRRTPDRILKGGVDSHGYPFVNLARDGRAKRYPLHQLVLSVFVGPRPDGMEVLHWDDDHAHPARHNLRYGTRSENLRDAVRNGRHRNATKTHCAQGHEFTAENTRQTVRRRECKLCDRERGRKRYAGMTDEQRERARAATRRWRERNRSTAA